VRLMSRSGILFALGALSVSLALNSEAVAVTGKDNPPKAVRREPFFEFRVTPDLVWVRLGEPITLHYELMMQEDVRKVEYVDDHVRLDGFALKSIPASTNCRRDVVGGRTVWRCTLMKRELRPYRVGELKIPVSRIRIHAESHSLDLSSRAVTIHVHP
jgi:hypothetical protein